MSERAAFALAAGARIGPYTCIRPLAQGGMAQLYLVRRRRWSRPVVCKVIRPEYADLEEFRSLFRREARVATRLRHRNILRTLSCDAEAPSPYLVMEHVEGPDLCRLLRRIAAQGETLELDVAVAIVIDIARALAHAHGRRGPDGHSLGLVHRDVSPTNILLSRDGRALLTDFGVARTREVTRTTKASSLKCKAGYVAPEQFVDGAVDARADVFSLGVVLYEATTGYRAFHDDNPYAQLNLVLTADFVDPTEVCPGYPEGLARIVRAALQKDKDQRLGSAAQLGAALRAFARAHGGVANRGDVARIVARYLSAPPRRRPRWQWATAGATVAAAVLAAGPLRGQDPVTPMSLTVSDTDPHPLAWSGYATIPDAAAREAAVAPLPAPSPPPPRAPEPPRAAEPRATAPPEATSPQPPPTPPPSPARSRPRPRHGLLPPSRAALAATK